MHTNQPIGLTLNSFIRFRVVYLNVVVNFSAFGRKMNPEFLAINLSEVRD